MVIALNLLFTSQHTRGSNTGEALTHRRHQHRRGTHTEEVQAQKRHLKNFEIENILTSDSERSNNHS